MSHGTESKIHVDDIPLSDLMDCVRRGHWRVPQFQREYVWKKTKVIELLDSIYQEFPIGSFFVWKAGREHNRLFREVPGLGVGPVGEHDQVWFVLDGQQRVTSLYVTLYGLTLGGTDYRNVCFDVQEEAFRDHRPDGKRYIALCDIWGPDALDLFEHVDAAHRPALKRCWKVLQTYPISIVEVRDQDLPAARRIFQRINQGGQRLERFDLISTTTFTPEFDLRERLKRDILAPLEEARFGAIEPSIVTQLLALLVHGQCTERYEFMLTADDIQGHWASVVDAVLLAADTLRKNVGVVNVGYLPYNAIFTLLSYWFAKSGQRSLTPAQLEWVKRWFWRASFSQHYGAAAPTQMGRDRALFDGLIAGQEPPTDWPVTLTVADLVGTRMTWYRSAVRNAFLCLMAHLLPVNLENNAPLDLVNGGISDFTSSEKHHLFPVAYLKREGPATADVHAMPNFCFLPAELNRRISSSDPATYVPELQTANPEFEAAARTHLIPSSPDSGLLTNDYPKFLQARAEMMLQEIGRLCGEITTPREEERQAAVGRLEQRLRDCIDEVLRGVVGEQYWKHNIPADVREAADNRIEDSIAREPGLDHQAFASSRARLDYANVMDYVKIIASGANWPYFESIFRRKDELQAHLAGFSDYRNHVMHGRPLTELVRMKGETAMVWFESVLPASDEPEVALELEGGAEDE